MSARYNAYALALELGYVNVDTMLEDLPAKNFFEWLAFFKIRNELSEKGEKSDKKNTGKDEQLALAARIKHDIMGYQKRLEAQNR